MAMLKTLCRKSGGCAQIQDYIAKEGRSLAYDYAPSVTDREHWAEQFDATRKIWEKDTGRKYYHIIISPDPDDECDLVTIRDIATSWMQERYPETEYVIGYHDEGGRIHAHIAMNSVIPDTGYKVHMSDDDVAADAMALQRMCMERGLSYFDDPRPKRGKDGWEASRGEQKRPPVVLGDAERRMLARGLRPWKQDIRDAIDASVVSARSWKEFEESMARRGIGVKVGRRNVVTFSHPEAQGKRRTVRGTVDNLGSAYTLRGIMLRMSKGSEREYTGVYEPAARKPIEAPKTLGRAIERRGRRRPWVDPQDVLDLIATMRKNGMGDARDLEESLADERRYLDSRKAALLEARARAALLDEADAKVARWREIEAGEDTAAMVASIDSYFEQQSLGQWFDEHAIDPASYSESSDLLKQEARAQAQAIADDCDERERSLTALANAMQTAQRIGMPMRETEQARAKRLQKAALPRRRSFASREELAALGESRLERTALRLERSDSEELKVLALIQREAILQKQIAQASSAQAPNGDEQKAEQARRRDQETRKDRERTERRRHEDRNLLP